MVVVRTDRASEPLPVFTVRVDLEPRAAASGGASSYSLSAAAPVAIIDEDPSAVSAADSSGGSVLSSLGLTASRCEPR